MLRDIKFIALFSLFALPLFLLLGVSGLVAILLVSSVCAIAAEWLIKRISRGAPRGDRKWLSIFLCAGISAAIAGLALTARVHLLVIAISVSGSPYDAPVINTPKLFFIFWGAVFVSVTAVLAVLRRKEGTLHHEK